MKYYSIIDQLVMKTTIADTYFFYNEEDVEKTIGKVICGSVMENAEYIVLNNEPLDDEKADFVAYSYGDIHYGYIMEE